MTQGPRRARYRLGISLVVVFSVFLTAKFIHLSPGALWSQQGWHNAWTLFSSLLHPELGSSFLSRVAHLMGESIAIGALGMMGALLLALPLSLLAARWPTLIEPPEDSTLWTTLSFVVQHSARTTLSVLRSIPELVWALLFVRVLGLGPGPAVFAITLSFGGIVGKLYAELIEACDPEPIRKLRAAGIGSWGVLWYGIFPQVRSQWVGYALFRFECAVRSATILGLVGAGGIGSEIALSIRYYQYNKLSTALLAVLLVIVLFEQLSAKLRNHRTFWSISLLAGASIGAVWMLDIPWQDWLQSSTLTQMGLFLQGFTHPNLSSTFVWNSLLLMGQTLGMAWIATLSAAALAFFLSPLATSVLWLQGVLQDPPRPIGPTRWLTLPLLGLSRLFFQLTRSLPDLVWALIFIVWVGPGPLAGALAIACHTLGIIGRLFGDTYEEAETLPLQALETSGTSTWGRWLYGILPQTMPRLLAYSLFRFEVNIRATAVIGFVGAGGIGDAIHTAISLFHFNDLATLLLLLFLSVVLVDAIGHRIRQQWLTPTQRP